MIALALLLAQPIVAQAAQEPATRLVEARITVVSAASVYLDQGSDAGLAPGDRARALPVGSSPVEIVVRAVSRQSARCEVLGAPEGLDIDVPVEVQVPEARFAAGSGAGTPAHDAWTHPPETWSSDVPLLAPAQSVTAEKRESRVSGRWYAGFDATSDHAGEDQTYSLGRSGFELRWENALGRGDELELDAEVFQRSFDGDSGSSEDDRQLRVDRASWRFGDTREDPGRLEVGRFLPRDVPQLGVLDGVEYSRRLDSGDRWGVGAGFLPDWSAARSTGDELALQAFYRHLFDEDGDLQLGAAVQKTWHEGERDRDLAIADLGWRASERWSFAATAWLDLYAADDAPKSSGLELTELIASATGRIDERSGVRASVLTLKWPALKQGDLPPLAPGTVADGELERASVDYWRDLTKHVRASVRADRWSSSDDSGGGGEMRFALRDKLWKRGEVSLQLFTSNGERIGVDGLRLGARGTGAAWTWSLAYEIAQRELEDFAGSGGTLDQQALRASFDRAFGRDWRFSLSLDQRFGDEQDASSAGFYLTRRF